MNISPCLPTILFFLFGISINAQVLKGSVVDSLNNPISPCNILVKKIDDPQIVQQFASTKSDGTFSILLKNEYSSLFIEVASFQFETKKIYLSEFEIRDNSIEMHIKLEPRITKLQEVVLEARTDIREKKDTVIYDASKFKTGAEKVVEDLLKNLPGIKVDDNGEIKFKGKPIKTILLDGDNLFDQQYKIASKNIAAEMIDKVVGIENYQENELLRGIQNGNEVVLNLVLKKGKSDLSNTLSLGLGHESVFDNRLNSLLTSRHIKSFNLITHNNLGINNTPYDFFLGTNQNEYDEAIRIPSLIQQGNFNSILDEKFHNINSNLYTGTNTLLKLNENSSLKINLGHYNDNISRLNTKRSEFFVENQNIIIVEENNLIKRPTLYDAKFNYQNKVKKNFHWNLFTFFNFNKTIVHDSSLNNELTQNNLVSSEQFNFHKKWGSTYKINEKSAITSEIKYTLNNNPEELELEPGTVIDNNLAIMSNLQKTRFQISSLRISSNYISKIGKINYGVNAIYDRNDAQFDSNLRDSDNLSLGSSFFNNNKYAFNTITINPAFSVKLNKIEIITAFNTKLYKLKIYENIVPRESELNEIVFTPNVLIRHLINRKNSLSFKYNYDASIPELSTLFSGIIQTDFRTFQRNDFELQLLKRHNYQMSFDYFDFFNAQKFNIYLIHSYAPNNYFVNNLIQQDISVNSYFLSNLSASHYRVQLSGETLINPLKTNFAVETYYNISNSRNIFNDSDIRDINAQMFSIEISLKKRIGKKNYIENKSTFNQTVFDVSGFKNNLNNIRNYFRWTYNYTQELNMNTIFNLVNTDLSKSTAYYFIDSELTYKPKKKKYSFSLLGKNLYNHKNFQSYLVNDVALMTMSHNLIERYFMLRFFTTF